MKYFAEFDSRMTVNDRSKRHSRVVRMGRPPVVVCGDLYQLFIFLPPHISVYGDLLRNMRSSPSVTRRRASIAIRATLSVWALSVRSQRSARVESLSIRHRSRIAVHFRGEPPRLVFADRQKHRSYRRGTERTRSRLPKAVDIRVH